MTLVLPIFLPRHLYTNLLLVSNIQLFKVSHPGNKQLHEIVQDFYDEYDNSNFESKTRIAEEIVVMMQEEHGGKFLKRDEKIGMWMEVTNVEARNKVSHSFRRKREYDAKAAEKVVSQVTQNEEGGGKRLRILQS